MVRERRLIGRRTRQDRQDRGIDGGFQVDFRSICDRLVANNIDQYSRMIDSRDDRSVSPFESKGGKLEGQAGSEVRSVI